MDSTDKKTKVTERLVILLTPDEMAAFSELSAKERWPKAVLVRDALAAKYPKIFKK